MKKNNTSSEFSISEGNHQTSRPCDDDCAEQDVRMSGCSKDATIYPTIGASLPGTGVPISAEGMNRNSVSGINSKKEVFICHTDGFIEDSGEQFCTAGKTYTNIGQDGQLIVVDDQGRLHCFNQDFAEQHFHIVNVREDTQFVIKDKQTNHFITESTPLNDLAGEVGLILHQNTAGIYIGMDGELVLLDTCGNYVNLDTDRFEVFSIITCRRGICPLRFIFASVFV